MKRPLFALLPLALVMAVTSCAGSNGAAPVAAPTLQQQPTPTTSTCPKVTRPRFAWPKEVPADLPQPPAATFASVRRTQDGLTIVSFSTATSLQDSVLFVVREVQKAGFTLGRGDAEPAEADAPFGRGNLRGVYKILSRTPCVSDWLVAVTRTQPTNTSPLLPTPSRAPGTSPKPLPFG